MEAQSASAPGGARLPGWLAGLLPLLLLGAAIGLFVALDAPGLGDRPGVPVEELAVERTVLRPGEIELHVRNDGPDPVAVRQVIVNDGFSSFSQSSDDLGRLGGDTIRVQYPWVEGEAYELKLLTATGATVDHTIDAAAESPDGGAGFLGLMALIGVYVGRDPGGHRDGVAPVAQDDRPALDAVPHGADGRAAGLPGHRRPARGHRAGGRGRTGLRRRRAGVRGRRGGLPGAGGRRLVDVWPPRAGEAGGAGPWRLAFLVALGIGLHNLGEGLAIGSAYAVGSLALGAALVVGFALHNTTEGLAIVAPVAKGEEIDGATRLKRLVGLGALAGAPAILGAFIGASAYDASLAAFMFGLGAGAIAQVIVQIAPSLRDKAGQLLHPLAVGGLLTGLALMYVTGLLVSV